MSSSPFFAVTSRPSRVKVSVASSGAAVASASFGDWVFAVSVKGTPPFLHVDEELVAEHADARGDRGGDGRAEHADGGLLRRPGHAGGDVVAEVHEEVQIFLAPGAVLNSVHDPLQPSRRS